MSIIKTALVAASLVAVAAAANAQGRGDLESGFHGNSPVVRTAPVAARGVISQDARGAFARSGAPAYGYSPYTPVDEVRASEANPLFDRFHGN